LAKKSTDEIDQFSCQKVEQVLFLMINTSQLILFSLCVHGISLERKTNIYFTYSFNF